MGRGMSRRNLGRGIDRAGFDVANPSETAQSKKAAKHEIHQYNDRGASRRPLRNRSMSSRVAVLAGRPSHRSNAPNASRRFLIVSADKFRSD